MRLILALALLSLLVTSLPFDVSAAKTNLAVREDYGTFEKGYDQPFRATAIIEGWCRNASVPLSDSRQIIELYHLIKDGDEKARLNKVGVLYYNDRGQECVCVDEGSVHPFVVTNVRGEMITILGWTVTGSDYGLDRDKVVVVESMDRLGDSLE